jgi:hypothetical protein
MPVLSRVLGVTTIAFGALEFAFGALEFATPRLRGEADPSRSAGR